MLAPLTNHSLDSLKRAARCVRGIVMPGHLDLERADIAHLFVFRQSQVLTARGPPRQRWRASTDTNCAESIVTDYAIAGRVGV